MKVHHLLLAATLLLAAPSSNAAGVGWSNPLGDTALLDSYGAPFDNAFVFEFGTFSSGFTPTAGNTNLWASNWKLLDRAIAPPDSITGEGFNVDFQYVTSAWDFNTNGTVQGLSGSATFAANEQAYLWVYCTNGEWALVTDSSVGTTGDDIWRLPDPTDTSPTGTFTWGLETADTAIVGSLNGTFNTVDYRLQTAQVAVVPEPSGALMVLLVGCVARVVRTRRRIA